jgi:hypothetical protein
MFVLVVRLHDQFRLFVIGKIPNDRLMVIDPDDRMIVSHGNSSVKQARMLLASANCDAIVQLNATTEIEVFLGEIDAQRPLGKLDAEIGNKRKWKWQYADTRDECEISQPCSRGERLCCRQRNPGMANPIRTIRPANHNSQLSR